MDVHNFLDIVAHTVVLHLTSKSMNNAVGEKISYVKNRAYGAGFTQNQYFEANV